MSSISSIFISEIVSKCSFTSAVFSVTDEATTLYSLLSRIFEQIWLPMFLSLCLHCHRCIAFQLNKFRPSQLQTKLVLIRDLLSIHLNSMTCIVNVTYHAWYAHTQHEKSFKKSVIDLWTIQDKPLILGWRIGKCSISHTVMCIMFPKTFDY